jgi:predicted transcriptional regulator
MRVRLPGLSAFSTFEAAARHQSFTRAAEELNVTPAAVSYLVRELEAAQAHRALGALEQLHLQLRATTWTLRSASAPAAIRDCRSSG